MRSTAHARCRLPAGLVLGFLLLGCCFNARAMPADFVGLQVSGISKHFAKNLEARSGYKFNEVHPGIGVEWGSISKDRRWVFKRSLGVMRDSYKADSAYAVLSGQYRFVSVDGWYLDTGLGVGSVYKAVNSDKKMRLLPAVAPVLTLGVPGDYRLNLLIVPPATVDKYEVPLIAYVQFVFPIQ